MVRDAPVVDVIFLDPKAHTFSRCGCLLCVRRGEEPLLSDRYLFRFRSISLGLGSRCRATCPSLGFELPGWDERRVRARGKRVKTRCTTFEQLETGVLCGMEVSKKAMVMVLVLSSGALAAHGVLVLHVGSMTYPNVRDQPADFGGDIPLEGVQGTLRLADPVEACTTITPHGEGPWIALIQRSGKENNCHFATQVYQAQAAGASAAVVYDTVVEPLLVMHRTNTDYAPTIPATFVSERSAQLLISLLDRHPQVTILDINGSTLASGLATVVLSCLALGIVMTTFYLMKLNSALLGVDESSQAEPDTLSTEQLEKLPIVVYDTVLVEEGLEKASSDSPRVGGMSREGCPICIEEYEDGEKVRVLPCFHLFHKECIDFWLTTQHKTCPVCKYNANEKKVKTHYSETVPLVVQHPELRQSYTDLTTLNAAESLLATSPHHPATPSRRMDEAIPGDALV